MFSGTLALKRVQTRLVAGHCANRRSAAPVPVASPSVGVMVGRVIGGRRRLAVLVAMLALGSGAAGAAIAAGGGDGRIGPSLGIMPSGRHLQPAGTLVPLGNFPTGGALTPDGRFYWTVSTGRGFNDIRIVSVADHSVVQTIPIPGASGGIAMDPRRPVAYVSGVADSSDSSEQRKGLPGEDGDVVQVLRYDPSTGQAQYQSPIAVPPPPGSPIPQGIASVPGLAGPPQSFPPTNTQRLSWPDRLAVSPDGGTLLVPLNLADQAAIVDTSSGQVRYVSVGHYPYGAAILGDGRTGLVSNESEGTVSVIDLGSGQVVKTLQVGTNLSHPEGIAVDPKADRAYVAIANSDQVAVIDTAAMTVAGTLSTERPQGDGTSPVALSVTPDGARLLVAEAGADEIAVFALPGHSQAPTAAARRARVVLAHESAGMQARGTASTDADAADAGTPALSGFELVGRVPTAAHPQDVATDGSTLVYIAAEGLGVGPNPNGPNPLQTGGNNTQSFQYLPNIVDGDAGILPFPSDAQVRAYTRTADAQLTPSNAESPPTGTPLRPGGPIKHVFYIVRENRTYDQVLGDDPRGDGDPGLTLFGNRITPNIHALVRRFPLLDHVYANSQASIDGHFWTSAAKVSDYVNKNWYQNYAGRGRPYDFGVYSVTWPQNGFLFDQAERQQIPYFNYGEAVAGVVPLPDKDRNAAETAEVARKALHSDLGPDGAALGAQGAEVGCYPNDAFIDVDPITQQETWDGTPPAGASPLAESRFECFKKRFDQQVSTGTVPAFNYLVLPEDHTAGTTPGHRTPYAMIADNDFGLGQIVDLISHSSIWRSSAIFVVEDDSQDGADHVDAHRIPAAVISPYARQGAVVHTRYDFLSVIRSIELILGMQPLGLFDRLATPMYDAFQPTPANSAPYTALPSNVDRTATNTASTAAAALSSRYDFTHPDQIPQRTLDRILWQYVHGQGAKTPPAGPGAIVGG
jgi:DNA-binding beta-propeller fold protein YncE